MSYYPPNPTPSPYPSAGEEKPGMVQAITIMTLINGILNILWAIGFTLGVILSTMGFGILCAPITILPGILGVFEILYAINLMAVPPKPVKPSQVLAILEICCIVAGNVISLVVGILALVFYNDPTVKAYFDRINPVRAI